MAARRCSLCALNYPHEISYKHCLRCGEETDGISNANPMSRGDLDELKREVTAVKERATGINEQWLVTYNDREGQNPNGEYRTEVFFATAYDVQDANYLINTCKRLHPNATNVRAVVHTGRPPKDGGPVAVVA